MNDSLNFRQSHLVKYNKNNHSTTLNVINIYFLGKILLNTSITFNDLYGKPSSNLPSLPPPNILLILLIFGSFGRRQESPKESHFEFLDQLLSDSKNHYQVKPILYFWTCRNFWRHDKMIFF